MSLRFKTFIILLVSLTCSLAVQTGISRLLLQNYKDLEEQQMRQSLERIQAELQSEVDYVKTMAPGWDRREQPGGPGYQAKTRLPPDFRLHLLGSFNDSSPSLTLTLFDQGRGYREQAAGLVDFLEDHPFLQSLRTSDTSRKGLILLPDGPMILSSHPIPDNGGGAASRVCLIFGRVLNEMDLARMADQMNLELNITRLDTGVSPDIDGILKSYRAAGDPFLITPVDSSRLAGYTVINDISGNPALLLAAEQDRGIYRQGVQTIRFFQWIILGTGLLFGLVFLFLLERQILTPIRRFTNAVSSIGARGTPSGHIPEEGSSEFRKWSAAINFMLDSLTQSRAELEETREQLEKRVRERSAELETAYTQLLHAEKLSCIGKMSASVAHEFGNPLFGIRNVLIHLQEKAGLNGPDLQLVNLGLRECQRMKNLISGLKDFHRPSPNLMTPVDIHQLLDETLLLFQKECQRKQIAVQRNYGRPLPAVTAVADQIKQVLLNLIKNAEEALPQGGGSITITTEALREEGMIAVRIQDTGSGIEPENLLKIFEPFFSTRQEGEGTGLGLSISHMIVKKHGGDIWVESEPGQGATFTITLPFSEDGEQKAED